MAKGLNNFEKNIGMIVGIVALGLVAIAGMGGCHQRAAANAGGGDASVSLTQDPRLYQGEAHEAYVVARDHPELLAQLDCYCGCEEHEGHKNLLDCFRTNHGAVCDICMGEAVTAGQMLTQGTPVDQIREALRARYGHGG
jgi:Protein of unknown function with PCYCGC motif